MSDTFWIGPDDSLEVGVVGFLIEIIIPGENSSQMVFRDTPAYTHRSQEPILYGWCGPDDDSSTAGMGLVRVERLARNGRAFVRELTGEDLRAGLEELGYPELMVDEDAMFTHVATSAKLSRCKGFFSELAAKRCASEWEAAAPVGANDNASPARWYAWADWLEIANQSGFDPIAELENAQVADME
jgi:hypothetical protein